jgi:hypothetical protein
MWGREESNSQSKGDSRSPSGMTTRKATAKPEATADSSASLRNDKQKATHLRLQPQYLFAVEVF